MSYTIEQLNEAVEETGWEYTYTPYRATEPVTETATGWSEFSEVIEPSRRYNPTTKEYETYEHIGQEIPGIGTARLVESHGGTEGGGEEYWIVFEVTAADGSARQFRREGWYASYDGGYLDGPTVEVKPVPKLITVYEKV